MNFEEMVQKAVNVKVKADLISSTIVQNLDIRCPEGHRLFNNTVSKVQTQGTTAKKPCLEESRPKEAKLAKEKAPTLSRTNLVEFLEQGKKDRKDKKQRFRKYC